MRSTDVFRKMTNPGKAKQAKRVQEQRRAIRTADTPFHPVTVTEKERESVCVCDRREGKSACRCAFSKGPKTSSNVRCLRFVREKRGRKRRADFNSRSGFDRSIDHHSVTRSSWANRVGRACVAQLISRLHALSRSQSAYMVAQSN